MKFPVSKFMTSNVATAKADDFLEDAYKKIKQKNIRHLPVIDDCGDVVGVISDRDFQRGMRRDRYNHLEKDKNTIFYEQARVGSFMSWPVLAISSSESLLRASKKMIENKVSALLVVEGDCLCGIVTHEDLLRLLVRTLEKNEHKLINQVQEWALSTPVGQVIKFLGDIGI